MKFSKHFFNLVFELRKWLTNLRLWVSVADYHIRKCYDAIYFKLDKIIFHLKRPFLLVGLLCPKKGSWNPWRYRAHWRLNLPLVSLVIHWLISSKSQWFERVSKMDRKIPKNYVIWFSKFFNTKVTKLKSRHLHSKSPHNRFLSFY